MENKKPETTKERAIKLGLIPAPKKKAVEEEESEEVVAEVTKKDAKAKKK